jgi:hypothetical protein
MASRKGETPKMAEEITRLHPVCITLPFQPARNTEGFKMIIDKRRKLDADTGHSILRALILET